MKRVFIFLCLVSVGLGQNQQKDLILAPEEQKATVLNDSSQYWSVTPASGTMDLNGPERLANPTFDANVTGWTGTLGLSLAQNTNSNRVRSGVGSAACRSDGTANGLFISSSGGSIITDATTNKQTWEAWVYLPTTNASDTVRAILYNQSASAIASGPITEPTKGTWTKLVVNAQLPGTQTGLRVGVQYGNPRAGDSLYVDDVSLSQAWDVIGFAMVKHPETGVAQTIFRKWNSALTGSGWHWVYRDDAANDPSQIVFSDGVSPNSFVSSGAGQTSSDNQWHCLVFTGDRTGDLKQYRDGVLLGTAVTPLSSKGKFNNTTDFLVGFNGGSAYTSGSQGELQVVRGTWTAAELAAIATQLSVTKKPKPAYPGQASGGIWIDWKNGGIDLFHIQPALTRVAGAPIVTVKY